MSSGLGSGSGFPDESSPVVMSKAHKMLNVT
jgi:hypothetical protein